MKKFEFSIIVSGVNPEDDDWGDRFYDNGCDDATVSFQNGRTIIDFTREAPSIEEAIASAVECVRVAGATVERIEPDTLVNQSDIAERAQITRAAVSLYVTGSRLEDFPLPVARITTTAPFYDWADVAAWFYRHDRLSKEKAIEAGAVKLANALIHDPHFRSSLSVNMAIFEDGLRR